MKRERPWQAPPAAIRWKALRDPQPRASHAVEPGTYIHQHMEEYFNCRCMIVPLWQPSEGGIGRNFNQTDTWRDRIAAGREKARITCALRSFLYTNAETPTGTITLCQGLKDPGWIEGTSWATDWRDRPGQ